MRLGIIGSGFGLYGILPAFHELKGCEIVAFCGEQTERLHNWMKKLTLQDSIHLYQDWRSLLSKESIDALAVAVPPQIQFEILSLAISEGIHIFAEKPLAANEAQAIDLLNLAERFQITHGIDFLFPEIDVWQEAKENLDKKRWGEVREVAVNWEFHSHNLKHNLASWKSDVTMGGGALAFYGSHILHYLEYFLGPIAELDCRFAHMPKHICNGEVTFDLTLEFQKGATGKVHLCSNVPGKIHHQLLFICERGTLCLTNQNSVIEDFVLTAVDWNGDKEEIFSCDRTPNKHQDNDERVICVRKLAARFVEAVASKKSMNPSFKEGARVQTLIEHARLAAYATA